MSKGTRWPLKAFQDKGLIEVDGKFVPGKNLVAKGKVDKITPIMEKYANNKSPFKGSDLASSILQQEPILNIQPLKELLAERNYGKSFGQSIAEAEQRRVNGEQKPYVHTESETFNLPNHERVYIRYSFDIKPCPAPRMSQQDKWRVDPYHPDPKQRQRPCVTRYFAWRDAFRILCRQKGYELEDVLRVIFIIPFPAYYSRKKREMKNGQKHQQRPDADNMIKSIKDSFGVDDGFVWDERSVKVWGEKGKILIF